MGIVRHILNIFLVVLILFAGLPQFCPEDADVNSRIDLGDAIQHVMDVAQSAGNQEDFTGSLGRAISTLTVLAGIKTVIQTNLGEKSLNISLSLNLSDFPSSCAFFISPIVFSEITVYTDFYKSIEFPPVSPPPRTV